MSAIIYTLVMTHITMLSVCIYLHRGMAHETMKFHPALDKFFRFWLWLTDGVDIVGWVVTHKKHHRHADYDGDPHSPVLLGIKKVAWDFSWQTVLLRYKSNPSQQDIERYAPNIRRNDWIAYLEKNHQRLGLFVMLAINVFLFGMVGIVIWVIQILWTPFWTCSVITGFMHYCGGYKHKYSRDNARNTRWLSPFLLGDEYHSNHHTYPSLPKLSIGQFEFDMSWQYIKLLRALKLLKVNARYV